MSVSSAFVQTLVKSAGMIVTAAAFCPRCKKDHAPICDRCGSKKGDFRSLHGPCGPCAFGKTKLSLRLSKEDRQAEKHFNAESKDWDKFTRALKSPAFEQSAAAHPGADEKLKRYVAAMGDLKQAPKWATLAKAPSQSNSKKSYALKQLPDGRVGCTCADWRYRQSVSGGDCKHVTMFKTKGKKKLSEDAVLAEAPKVRNVSQLEASLELGDVLLAARKAKRGVIGHIFNPISKLVQGTGFGHAAIYVGDGQIIESRIGKKVQEVSLEDLASHSDILAVSPPATARSRQRAVEYARSQVGKNYSVLDLIRAGTPFRGSRKGESPEKSESQICSALVANAYPRVKFSKGSRSLTRPVEILKAPNVEPVALLLHKG
jgi:uncharacterized protein YycO